MSFPVFDLHCDTALALLGDGYRQCGSLRNNTLHIDLDRASKLPGYAQCFACFTTTDQQSKISPTELFERELASVLREVEKNQNLIRLAYNADDVVSNYNAGHSSAILTIEGPAGFGYDPALLEDLYQVGFRMSTLGWNEQNVLAGSNVTGGKLSDLGAAYVREAQRLGLIIDVSHISDEAFWDIIDITDAPIVASHSNSRSVCPHSRNITDDMFAAICRTNGVVGINLYADFIGGDHSLDSLCKHITHFLELDPTGRHIALGSDFDGCAPLCYPFEGIQDYPRLADKLLAIGIDEELVRNIFWNNALEVFRRCCT